MKDGYHYTCKQCKNIQGKAYKEENKDKIKESSAQYYLEKKEVISVRNKEWKENNKELIAIKRKEYHEKNKDMQSEKAKVRRQNNKPNYNAKAAAERAAKKNATPKWLTKDHKTFIEIQYQMAKYLEDRMGEEYHVDHIHPLQNDSVCGLHVPWNLRVIPAFDNLSKGNKLIGGDLGK